MTETVHTLTIYGKNLRVIVQSKGLTQKQGSEVAAHFEKTVGQAILDAPHIGILKEHQIIERLGPPPADVIAPAVPKLSKTRPPVKTRPSIPPAPKPPAATDRAGRPLKAAKKAKKARKRG